MSIWSDDPEWFDEWLERKALEGDFGPELQKKAEDGNFFDDDMWDLLDKDGKLGQEATADYCDRFMP